MLKLRKRYPICYPNIIIDGKERTEDVMEKDMKKQIAEASRELLFEDQVKKLTVKAIVDKCTDHLIKCSKRNYDADYEMTEG